MTGTALATFQGEHLGLVWQSVRIPVHPSLHGLVEGISGYAEYSARPVRRRETPNACVPVILSLGPAIDVSGTRHLSFAAGLHDSSAHTTFVGEQRGVEVRLTPQGAHRLLGIPPGEYPNTAINLPLLDRIAERTAAAADWGASLATVQDELLRRAAAGPAPDRAVTWAWRALRRSGGTRPIGDLAAEIGWSRRHFAARFRTEIGLPPKVVARVLRFERAVTQLTGGAPAAAVAARCGYADQSHLVREFRALAGCTPTAYLRELDAEQVAFVQDGVPAGV